MRKFLGFLVLLVLMAGGGAYYYLTKIFPEAQVVAMIESAAVSSGAVVTYDSIEPGHFGIDGTINNLVISEPDDSAPASIAEVYYKLDPIWILSNLRFLYEHRTLAHYDTLELRNIETIQSNNAVKVESVSFSDLDYTKLVAKKAQQSAQPDSALDQTDFWAADVSVSRVAITDGMLNSPEGNASITKFEIAEIGKQKIGKLRLDALVIDMPDSTIRLDRIEGRDMHFPTTTLGNTEFQPSLRSADHFEISGLLVLAQGTAVFEMEQLLYQENDHKRFARLGEIATDTRFDIRGIKFPTALMAAEPKAYEFFLINNIETISLDLLNHSTLDIDTGLSETSGVLAVKDLFTLNSGVTLSGFNEEFFQSMGNIMSTVFADAFKSIWTRGFASAQEDLARSQQEAEALFEKAFFELAINQMAMGYDDHSMADKVVNYVAYRNNMTADQARAELFNSAVSSAVAMEEVPVVEEVISGVASVLAGGTGFNVTVTIDPPLSIGEVAGIAETENPVATVQTSLNDRVKTELTIKGED